tara:strand:+ start:10 stop:621 length:612 start_codon:yes stop_codon:yes gene_type:complete
MIRKIIFSCAVAITSIQAQETPAPAAAPPQCPVQSGTFAELNAIGVVLINQGNIVSGEDCLSRALGTTVPTYRALSDIAVGRKDFRRAAALSEMALRIDGAPASQFFHARRLLQGGDVAGSLSILDRLSSGNQEDSEFLHMHGISQFRNDQASNALASLTRACQLNPDNKGYGDDLTAVKKAILDAEVAAAEPAAAAAKDGAQ